MHGRVRRRTLGNEVSLLLVSNTFILLAHEVIYGRVQTRMLRNEVGLLSVRSIYIFDLSILLCKSLDGEYLLDRRKSQRLFLTPTARIVAV